MPPVYEIDCSGITTPDDLWRRYLDTVPTLDAASFGYTLDSFWDAVQWGGPGDPGECELVFTTVAALDGLRTRGGDPFLTAFRRLVSDTDRIKIRLV
jgi:hypothetical protein